MTYIGIDVSKATFVVYRHGVLRMQPKGRKQVGLRLASGLLSVRPSQKGMYVFLW